MVAPTAQRSVRPSTSSQSARACSGAMKAGVPMLVPTRVALLAVDISRSLAIPKSSTFTWPVRVRKTFSGFRSRWTIPFAWAATRTSTSWSATERTSSSVSFPPLRTRRPSSVSPSSSSETRNGELGTTGFAAPELFGDAHRAGPAADVYALGRIAAWAVTREWPQQNVPLLPTGAWRQFVRHTTEHDAARRPQEMKEVLSMLDQVEVGLRDGAGSGLGAASTIRP